MMAAFGGAASTLLFLESAAEKMVLGWTPTGGLQGSLPPVGRRFGRRHCHAGDHAVKTDEND